MEPEVQRVENGAGYRDGEVRLEMLMMIPSERGDAVAGTDAVAPERVNIAADADAEVAVGVAMKRTIGTAGHDLAARVHLFRVAEDRPQRQGEVHHQAVHRSGL